MLLCQHLAIAKERLYDASLIDRLNNLVLALYRELYRYRSETRLNLYAFFKRDFPLAIYRHRYFILIAFIVFVERAHRRVVVQYPKRQQGSRMTGGESSHLPLKLNTAGVIPPIFASSILLLPITVASFSA